MNGFAPQTQFDITGSTTEKPVRLGFLGLGWIGRHRMEAMLASGLVEAVAIADPSVQMIEAACQLAPNAEHVRTLEDLLMQPLDGIVIATPSAQHAEQAIRALEAGVAVFCQKPLGRSGKEARAVVDAAKAADRLLGVDLSYRHTQAMCCIKELVRNRQLGKLFAVDLTFHNAYGPDKPWFYDKALSGGGCVIDLGVHLIDLALWVLDFPKVVQVSSHLMSGGEPLSPDDHKVEDFAFASLMLEGGTIVRLTCSWRLQAGRDAVIEANFFGTEGGASMRNVNGSFYDFEAARFRATSQECLVSPTDEWGGRAALAWVRQLARGVGYDRDCETLVQVSEALDRIYLNAES